MTVLHLTCLNNDPEIDPFRFRNVLQSVDSLIFPKLMDKCLGLNWTDAILNLEKKHVVSIWCASTHHFILRFVGEIRHQTISYTCSLGPTKLTLEHADNIWSFAKGLDQNPFNYFAIWQNFHICNILWYKTSNLLK